MTRLGRNTLGFLAGFLAVLIFVLAFIPSAHAWEKKPPKKMAPPPNVQIDVDASAGAQAEAGAYSRSSSNATTGPATAMTGPVSVDTGPVSVDTSAAGGSADSQSSTGDMVSTNTSQFYALSLMFPGASDCFTGVQGGAQDADASNASSGFLGFHMLNKSCWLDRLASQETDIEINARLKCGDRKYRNAVAYDSRAKNRQRDCIAMKVASGQDKMRNLRDELAAIEASNTKRINDLKACHARVEAANERTERCFTYAIGEK